MNAIIDTPSNAPAPIQSSSATTTSGVMTRVGLFIVFLACSLAIYLLGANYYPLFPTNGNLLYNACVCVFFLAVAILLKRTNVLTKYWGVAYAFFIAASVNLVSIIFTRYQTDVLRIFGAPPETNAGLALGKLYDTVLVVIPILVLTLMVRSDIGSLYLKVGNLNRKWGLGIGALVLVNYFTSVLIFHAMDYKASQLLGAILWGVVFSFSNSILEELWIRGLILRKFLTLIGSAGAVLLTSITFASLHFLGVAYLPASVIPIFVANTFTLGLACGILMLKTDSIWGAYLIHAAADLFLFIATLAYH